MSPHFFWLRMPFWVALVSLMMAPSMAAQSAKPEYLLLDTNKTSTMQKELQDAADRGYRLAQGQGSWPLSAILEKPQGEVEPIEYLLLSTSKTKTMQKEMDEASAQGYRFASVLGIGHEVIIAMQRKKGNTTRTHEQKLLAAVRMKTMEGEFFAEVEKGFRFVGQTVFESFVTEENVAILERSVQ